VAFDRTMNYKKLLIENIDNTSKILNSIPNIDYELYREQLWNNSRTITYFKSKNDTNKSSIYELNSLNDKLTKWFHENTWRFTINDFSLLNFNKVYKSQLKFHIEWHAGSANPHLFAYYVKLNKSGFFNIQPSSPKFESELLNEINNKQINFNNIFKIPKKGEIKLTSNLFSLDGKIIGDMIIDKNIDFKNYKDGEKIIDSNMLLLLE